MRKILILAAVLQLILLIGAYRIDPEFIYASEGTYREAAKNLLEHGVYSSHGYPTFAAEISRPPVFPFFIALVYALTGHSHLAFIVFQNIISLINVYLMFRLSMQLFNHKSAALLGAGAYAISFLRTGYVNVDYAEVFTVLFVLLSLLSLFHYLRSSDKILYVWVAAILLGLSIHCKPVNYYLGLLYIALIAFKFYQLKPNLRATFRACVMPMVAILVPLLILVGGWQVRNYVQTGFSGFSTLKEYTFYYWFSGNIVARNKGISLHEAKVFLHGEMVRQGIDKLPIGDQADFWRSETVRYVTGYPLVYAQAHIRGMLLMMAQNIVTGGPMIRFYSLEQQDEIGKILVKLCGGNIVCIVSRITDLIGAGYYAVFLATLTNIFWHLVVFAGLIAFFIKYRTLDERVLFVLLLIFYYWFTGGPAGQARYRNLIEPFFCIISAVGYFYYHPFFVQKWQAFRNWKKS